MLDEDNPVNVAGSLRNRLAVTLIGGVAILTVLLVLVIRGSAAQIAQQSQDSILGASLSSILDTAVIRDGQVQIDLPYSAFSMLNTRTDDRVFYAIYQDETWLSGYADLAVRFDTANLAGRFESVDHDGMLVRQATASRILLGADVRIVITAAVAQTQDSLAVTLDRISRNAGVAGLAFFTLAVLLSAWATSTTIRPLKRLAASVARRGPGELSPIAQPVPSEMEPLVSSFNKLMQRLERSFRQSEDFIAEAAHRVRTPLATVRSQAESTLHRVDREENRQSLRSMIRAIDESSRAAGQILDHAMITFRADQMAPQSFDLVELVQDIVLRLGPVADMKDIVLQLEGECAVQVSADAILVQNAVRNLIDNALKYSPSEQLVSIRVGSEPAPWLEVRDRGPGFPDQEIAMLAERFARGSNAQGTIGSGLGLTIARDVALAHGGHLSISNHEQGGACARFCF